LSGKIDFAPPAGRMLYDGRPPHKDRPIAGLMSWPGRCLASCRERKRTWKECFRRP